MTHYILTAVRSSNGITVWDQMKNETVWDQKIPPSEKIKGKVYSYSSQDFS